MSWFDLILSSVPFIPISPTNFRSLLVLSLNAMRSNLAEKERLLHQERKKRWAAVAAEVAKRCKIESELHDVNEWAEELGEELSSARRAARSAAKAERVAVDANTKAQSVNAKRLAALGDLKTRLAEAQDNLADESQRRHALEKMSSIQLQIKRERPLGRRGGSSKWPAHVVLLICEQLVNGTPPSAIPANIQSMCAALTGASARELPTVSFVRSCRTVVQIMNETLAAMRLSNANEWFQMNTDGTSRRQTAFANLIVSVRDGNDLDPVVVSSCLLLETESSENHVKAIMEQVR